MKDLPPSARVDDRAPEGDKEPAQAKTATDESPRRKRRSTLEDLRKTLEEKKQLAQDNYEKFLRAYAELENYKKRVERERADSLRHVREELIRDILPFIDNLRRAVGHAAPEADNDPKALVEGVDLTLRELMRVLEKYGLEPIESVGRRFDPNLHEAMMQVESETCEPQTVVEEFQRGYLLKDRLLRPARVSVATRPQPEDESAEGKA